MKVKSIEIKNYRAIAELKIPLNYSINPIIGVNESGKTSVLKGILCLDKGRDRHNKGEHLTYQNKYSTKDTENCVISAEIQLSTSEIEEFIIEVNLSTGSESYNVVQGLKNDDSVFYARILSDNRKFRILNDQLPISINQKLTKFIQKRFPVFLYFDDFTDRVPEEVIFPDAYVGSGELSRGKQREWQEIIEEIVKRSELEGIDDRDKPLQNYFRVEDRDRKDDILSDITAVLNSEIMDEWKKVKQRGKGNYADDSEHLLLELKNDDKNKYQFQFKVRDKSNQDRRRTFNVNERSKGFQWFFNYMIKLKFNPRYKDTKENSIFLLDEPGSYLHSSAQSELLKELKTVSQNNTIIYCTHSQFLLNPEDIKLGSIKIAEKKESVINLSLFGKYKGKQSGGALSPVYQALQLNQNNDFVGNLIITEGITDFYILKMTQAYWNYPLKDTKIIPGNGAGGSSTLISFAIGFSEKFKVVFDNDRGGREAITKYKKEFGNEIEGFFHIYHNTIRNFKLENHFSKKDQKALLNLTQSSSIKKAIPILFLDQKDKIESYLNGMEKESKALLGQTINDIGF